LAFLQTIETSLSMHIDISQELRKLHVLNRIDAWLVMVLALHWYLQ